MVSGGEEIFLVIRAFERVLMEMKSGSVLIARFCPLRSIMKAMRDGLYGLDGVGGADGGGDHVVAMPLQRYSKKCGVVVG